MVENLNWKFISIRSHKFVILELVHNIKLILKTQKWETETEPQVHNTTPTHRSAGRIRQRVGVWTLNCMAKKTVFRTSNFEQGAKVQNRTSQTSSSLDQEVRDSTWPNKEDCSERGRRGDCKFFNVFRLGFSVKEERGMGSEMGKSTVPKLGKRTGLPIHDP